MKLTEREVQLVKGLIQICKDHSARCEKLTHTYKMAELQVEWDQERIAFLERVLNESEFKEA